MRKLRERRRRLSEVRRLVPLIVSAASESIVELASDCPIARLELTSTGVAVVVVAPLHQPARAVIKLPMIAEAVPGLSAETSALTALHADDRLGDWRRLIPQPRASGTFFGRPYRVDSALPGRNVTGGLGDAAATQTMVDAAAETIQELHRRTSVDIKADDDVVERWIDSRVRDLITHSHFPPSKIVQLQRVQAELHAAVEGRTFSASSIHGDYWLGNILFSGGQPSGVVDWDAVGWSELPLIDVLHLVLYTRRLLTGQELGEIVRAQLSGRAWSRRERLLLETHGWRGDSGLPDRPALLLYWLRHVAHHARQEPAGRGIAHHLWERRNVRRVMTAAQTGA